VTEESARTVFAAAPRRQIAGYRSRRSSAGAAWPSSTGCAKSSCAGRFALKDWLRAWPEDESFRRRFITSPRLRRPSNPATSSASLRPARRTGRLFIGMRYVGKGTCGDAGAGRPRANRAVDITSQVASALGRRARARADHRGRQAGPTCCWPRAATASRPRNLSDFGLASRHWPRPADLDRPVSSDTLRLRRAGADEGRRTVRRPRWNRTRWACRRSRCSPGPQLRREEKQALMWAQGRSGAAGSPSSALACRRASTR